MPSMNAIFALTIPFLPLLATLIFMGLLLWGMHYIFIGRHPDLGNERLFPRQLLMLAVTLVGIIAIVLALPVSTALRNQVVGLVGLIISGVLAFSSSTIFANLMAGIMLRITKPFRTGDFINVKKEYFGRVVERGLLDTEIQTENRELIAFPNTFLSANPVSVVRSSGAIVSSTLSLGYDINHVTVETLLLQAAGECGLEEPFIHVLELGNYAITYKVSGMLTDTKNLLTARSNLCRCVLDVLHENDIEIMSPAFMNQRRVPEETKIIPAIKLPKKEENVSVAEAVVFDKAEKAEQIENEKQQLLDKIAECEKQLEQSAGSAKKHLQKTIKKYREQLTLIESPEGEAGTNAIDPKDQIAT